MKNTVEQINKTKEFYRQFEERTGCVVESVVFSRIVGTKSIMDELGLSLLPGQDDLPGVLVFCDKDLFFYVPSTELAIMGIKVSGGRYQTSFGEQLLAFSSLDKWTCTVEKKRFFLLELFSTAPSPDFCVSFIGKQGQSQKIWFSLNDSKKINIQMINRYSK